jgi:hypothetical protein
MDYMPNNIENIPTKHSFPASQEFHLPSGITHYTPNI